MSAGIRANHLRDLSWLQFNGRVLHEAIDARTPLLEKVKFIQIFTTNLDEFFMKRAWWIRRDSGDAGDLTEEVRRRVVAQLQLREDCWRNIISPQLEREGILLLEGEDLIDSERQFLAQYFDQNLFPVLTPLLVDPGHPFPFLSNLSTSIGVLLGSEQNDVAHYNKGRSLFARVKISQQFPSWIRLPSNTGEQRFVSLHTVIQRFVETLFPGMEIKDTFPFRITRNTETEKDQEDPDDLLAMVAEELRERRFGDVVRLEHSPALDPTTSKFLRSQLEITESHVYQFQNEVDFSSLEPIWGLPEEQLKHRPWVPVTPESLKSDSSIFAVIQERDLLVHHPYESFAQTVERFIASASEDPKVLAIKMTLYRTGVESPFIPLLVRAAESGKQVVCLVELKARFDEAKNIEVASRLGKAGVHVVHGMVGLKTHCKLALVVRNEPSGIRSYVHLGTGNYRVDTSELYTDLSFFTCRPELTRDVVELFHFITGRSRKADYRNLLVAPVGLKQQLLQLLRQEGNNARQGKPAHVIAKMNGLEDRDIIAGLIDAARAGVKVDLIVRGVCCLVPGFDELKDNLKVISIIGRFLEHSRITYFRAGAADPLEGRFMIGSADWMQRNLDRRVEAVATVDDAACRSQLWDYLQLLLNDRRHAWELQADGEYLQRTPTTEAQKVGVHEKMMRIYQTAQREQFSKGSVVQIRGLSVVSSSTAAPSGTGEPPPGDAGRKTQ